MLKIDDEPRDTRCEDIFNSFTKTVALLPKHKSPVKSQDAYAFGFALYNFQRQEQSRFLEVCRYFAPPQIDLILTLERANRQTAIFVHRGKWFAQISRVPLGDGRQSAKARKWHCPEAKERTV